MLCDILEGWGRVGVGGRFKKEETYVYLWLIHVNVWQKPMQCCKVIILQLRINAFLKKEEEKKKEQASISSLTSVFQCHTVSVRQYTLDKKIK